MIALHAGPQSSAANSEPAGAIRVVDAAGNVIETHEDKGDFKEW
jgi:hypothetical protein